MYIWIKMDEGIELTKESDSSKGGGGGGVIVVRRIKMLPMVTFYGNILLRVRMRRHCGRNYVRFKASLL